MMKTDITLHERAIRSAQSRKDHLESLLDNSAGRRYQKYKKQYEVARYIYNTLKAVDK